MTHERPASQQLCRCCAFGGAARTKAGRSFLTYWGNNDKHWVWLRHGRSLQSQRNCLLSQAAYKLKTEATESPKKSWLCLRSLLPEILWGLLWCALSGHWGSWPEVRTLMVHEIQGITVVRFCLHNQPSSKVHPRPALHASSC